MKNGVIKARELKNSLATRCKIAWSGKRKGGKRQVKNYSNKSNITDWRFSDSEEIKVTDTKKKKFNKISIISITYW